MWTKNVSQPKDIQNQCCLSPTLLYDIPSNTDVISAGVDTVTTTGCEDIRESSSCTGNTSSSSTWSSWNGRKQRKLAFPSDGFLFYNILCVQNHRKRNGNDSDGVMRSLGLQMNPVWWLFYTDSSPLSIILTVLHFKLDQTSQVFLYV